ncbi:MAG: hypothetical protein WAN35_14020 [Terracidiphilus sp.]
MRRLRLAALPLVSILPLIAFSQTARPIPTDAARMYFAEAQALCQADHGDLWGISLCGPMIFAETKSHFAVANQADANGFLKPEDGVFAGILPTGINVTNSPFEWSGVLWTMMVWPLPAEEGQRKTLMAHELFHRIQPRLNLPVPQKGENAQLDMLEGRYTLQLELRALTRALRAQSDEERKKAATDAILFRAERYRLFPGAAAQEEAMEWNEGLAEFTGIRVGNLTPEQRVSETLGDISRLGEASTFVRSFPYATGPAYGLLLDRYSPGWYRKLKIGDGYGTLLAAALHYRLPANLHQDAERQAALYGGVALRATEVEIDKKRQQILAQNRAKFVDGPTLTLPFRKMRVQFDPRTLQPLEGAGTVYGKMRISDEWGVLEASSGALMKTDWSAVIVVAPAASEGSSLKGDGWTLELKPGWKILPAARKGDFILAQGS